MRLQTISSDSVMLYFEEVISEEVLEQVTTAYHALKSLPHILDLTPSYHSVLVRYDMAFYDHKSIQETINKHLKHAHTDRRYEGKTIEISVDYSKGMDLERIAAFHGISTQEVIEHHVNQTYKVYAIGFIEGFAYLAKVDDIIVTPRLETPRKKVPKGSVAIADSQTAIYPSDSPGGWNIVGHTDFTDFHLFEVGDSLRFVRV